jgi:hypothetical protein
MSNLSTFYKPAITRADLGLGTANNVTFASIQNTPIGSTTASTVAATNLSASGTVSGTGFSNYLAAPPAIGNTTPAEGTFTTLTLADGTRLLPSFFFADDTNTGFFRRGADTLTFVSGGASRFEIGNQGPRLSSNDFLAWALNGDLTGSSDLALHRDAADTLAQRRSTTAQTFNIYNTHTSATNHERGFLKWSSNVFQIGTEKGSGGGSARALEFQTDGVTRLTFTSTGQIQTRQGLVFQYFSATASNHSANLQATGDGVLRLTNNGNSDFNRVQFGGTDSTFPALKRSSATLQVRLADDSAFGALSCGALTLNGNLDASTRDIVTDTTTGTKIGTGTTQKIGFFNATPVVQQAAVADATDAASTQARLNDLLARLRTLGLIAT